MHEFTNCSSAKKTARISSKEASLGILLARANSVQAHADARSLIILSARADSQGSCKCREFEYTVMTGSSQLVIGSKGGLRFDEAASRRG